MEIYRAVSDFTAPNAEGTQNILSFKRGDKFEVFDSNIHKDWWGVRRLHDNTIGYAPSKYLKHEELRVGSVLPENYQEHREKNLKRFSAMQNSEKHKHPEELYTSIPEPDPDYLNDDDTANLPPPPSPLSEDGASQSPNGNPTTSSGPTIIRVKNGSMSSVEEDRELKQPRKLSNPCLESRERQALHKELLLNYRLGKDVLKKPELEKMLQKRKDAQKRKEWEEVKASKRTSFELMLEERANRLKVDEEKMKPIKEKEDDAPELVRMHRKITSKPPTSPS